MPRILIASLTASLSLSAYGDRDIPVRYRRLDVPDERLRSADVQRQGWAIFRERCALCHGDARVEGHPRAGRDLAHLRQFQRVSAAPV